jgi:hypothetical protein
MIIKNENVWVIMSKDRKLIAKGVPRDRSLELVDDLKDKKRILTYASKGKAESAFKISGFYGQNKIEGFISGMKISDFLEAVECKLSLTEIKYEVY